MTVDEAAKRVVEVANNASSSLSCAAVDEMTPTKC